METRNSLDVVASLCVKTVGDRSNDRALRKRASDVKGWITKKIEQTHAVVVFRSNMDAVSMMSPNEMRVSQIFLIFFVCEREREESRTCDESRLLSSPLGSHSLHFTSFTSTTPRLVVCCTPPPSLHSRMQVHQANLSEGNVDAPLTFRLVRNISPAVPPSDIERIARTDGMAPYRMRGVAIEGVDPSFTEADLRSYFEWRVRLSRSTIARNTTDSGRPAQTLTLGEMRKDEARHVQVCPLFCAPSLALIALYTEASPSTPLTHTWPHTIYIQLIFVHSTHARNSARC